MVRLAGIEPATSCSADMRSRSGPSWASSAPWSPAAKVLVDQVVEVLA